MINFKYLTDANEERIYDYLNNLTNCQGCFCSKVYIRFLHGVTGAPAVDIYIDGNMVAYNLSLGQITNYVLYYPGNYSIQVYATKDTKNPLIDKVVTFNRNTAYTIAVAGDINDFDLYIVKEYKNEIPPFNDAVVTYTNFTPIDEAFDLYISDGTVLYKDISYGETMPNVSVFPTDERFDLKYSDINELAASTPMIQLQRNTYYSLFSILDNNNKVKIIITESGLNYLDIC